jgi:CheY-like chemotaxis protein
MAAVLIVDDDDDVASATGDLLRSEGHEVRIAANGEHGLRLIAETHPDVIVLDVEMPVLDGPSMAYQLLVRDCGLESIPIVLVSGKVGLRQTAALVGTPYALGKPCDAQALLDMLDRALREGKTPRGLGV